MKKRSMRDFDLDPERKLWVPGRRRFLFLGLGALAAHAFGVESCDMRLRWLESTNRWIFSEGTGLWHLVVDADKLALAG